MQAKQNRQREGPGEAVNFFIDGREYSGTCAPNASMSYEIRGGSNLPRFCWLFLTALLSHPFSLSAIIMPHINALSHNLMPSFSHTCPVMPHMHKLQIHYTSIISLSSIISHHSSSSIVSAAVFPHMQMLQRPLQAPVGRQGPDAEHNALECAWTGISIAPPGDRVHSTRYSHVDRKLGHPLTCKHLIYPATHASPRPETSSMHLHGEPQEELPAMSSMQLQAGLSYGESPLLGPFSG